MRRKIRSEADVERCIHKGAVHGVVASMEPWSA